MIWLFFLLITDPVQFQARMSEGVAALYRGGPRAAQASFESATRLADDSGAWMMVALTLARENQSGRAREAANKAEALGSGDQRMALANFYTALVPDLPKAASVGAHTAWRNVAAIYLDTGDTSQAIAAARQGLATDKSGELHTILGRALGSRQEWPAACAEFEAAIQLNPYNEEPRFLLLAQTYLLRQDFTRAAAVLQDAREVFDKSPQIELALGVTNYGQRNFDAAVTQFLRNIALAPDVPQYIFLGRILEHAAARLPEITERFSRFENQHPASELGYTLHAKALMLALPPTGFPPERKRECAAAASELERSIQLNAKDSAVHFRLARVDDRLGRREDAERELALHEKLSGAEGSAPPPGLVR